MIEKVAIAAVSYEDKIYTGARHVDIKANILGECGRYPFGCTEGFLTNTDRFVERKEAAEIAFKAGQTRSKLNFLYSEDIY